MITTLLPLGSGIFLDEATYIQVVGEVINGLDAIELVDNLSPDVLILDLQIPMMLIRLLDVCAEYISR